MRRVIAENTSPLSSTMEGSVVDRKIEIVNNQRGIVRPIEDERAEDNDASRHPEKRRKISHDFTIASDDDERDTESVEDVRQRMLGLLQTKMSQKKTTDASDGNEANKRLHTVESILFATAESLDEYKNEETLDTRLRTLLRALLERKLRLAAKTHLI